MKREILSGICSLIVSDDNAGICVVIKPNGEPPIPRVHCAEHAPRWFDAARTLSGFGKAVSANPAGTAGLTDRYPASLLLFFSAKTPQLVLLQIPRACTTLQCRAPLDFPSLFSIGTSAAVGAHTTTCLDRCTCGVGPTIPGASRSVLGPLSDAFLIFSSMHLHTRR
jgi:hypothetical protein